jgi:hypothetical protein
MPQNDRHHSLPSSYFPRVEACLNKVGYHFNEPGRLAQAVLKLSDHYTTGAHKLSPWLEPWAQAASLAYYFPLNYSRAQAVAAEALRLGFFEGIEDIFDFGSGMGSALHAFADRLEKDAEISLTGASARPRFSASDSSALALDLAQELAPPARTFRKTEISVLEKELPSPFSPSKTALLASYVYAELSFAPEWWFECEALIIIEPSTSQSGRRLMELRSELMQKGFQIWAPCTHQEACPFLVHSKKDWCHDRIHFDPPGWYPQIEKYLPMKNRTLTFSYLLARKSPAPKGLNGLSRLVGDRLDEKGKTRQSVCRGPEREFLAWFPQRMEKNETIEFARGNLLKLAADLPKKSDEIRIQSPTQLQEISIEEKLNR